MYIIFNKFVINILSLNNSLNYSLKLRLTSGTNRIFSFSILYRILYCTKSSNKIFKKITNMLPNILSPWTPRPRRPSTKRGKRKKLITYLRTFRAKESGEWREIKTGNTYIWFSCPKKKSTLSISTGTRLIFPTLWSNGEIAQRTGLIFG